MAEVESPSVMIKEWWERLVRLDKNLRQSKVEKKMLGGKGAAWMARPPEAQLFRETRPFWNNGNQGSFHRALKGGFSRDLRRRDSRGQEVWDLNAIEVDRGWGGDQRCFNCGMSGHMA